MRATPVARSEASPRIRLVAGRAEALPARTRSIALVAAATVAGGTVWVLPSTRPSWRAWCRTIDADRTRMPTAASRSRTSPRSCLRTRRSQHRCRGFGTGRCVSIATRSLNSACRRASSSEPLHGRHATQSGGPWTICSTGTRRTGPSLFNTAQKSSRRRARACSRAVATSGDGATWAPHRHCRTLLAAPARRLSPKPALHALRGVVAAHAKAIDEDIDQPQDALLPTGLVVHVAHADEGPQKVFRADITA